MFNYRLPPQGWLPYDIRLSNLKLMLEKANKKFDEVKEKWMRLNPEIDFYDYSFENMQESYDEVVNLEAEIKVLLRFTKG